MADSKDTFVRIRKNIVKKVANDKKKTRIPIGLFFEQAAIEKLERQKISQQIGNVITQPKD